MSIDMSLVSRRTVLQRASNGFGLVACRVCWPAGLWQRRCQPALAGVMPPVRPARSLRTSLPA